MRLRFILRERDTRGAINEEVLSVYREHGVIPKTERDDNFNKTPQDLSLYKLVLPGDIVVNKMKAWQGSIAVSRYRGIVSGDYLVCAVTGEVNGRFLHHLLRSAPLISEYAKRSKGVRPSQWRLYWEDLADIEVDLPDRRTQERVADYLDAETARIDALIDKKRQMVELLREHWQAELSQEFAISPGVRLKRLLSAPLAYGVLVPEHVEDGVPMLRILDLAARGVDLDTVTRIPPNLSAQYRRTVVREGDLVVSVVGTLGHSIEITPELAGCNINRALARVQLLGEVPRSLIRHWFASDVFQRMAREATASDSAQRTLGLGDLKNFAVGIPEDSAGWPAIAERLDARHTAIQRPVQRLGQQISLLVEHRQALITAAATGELDIPGLAA